MNISGRKDSPTKGTKKQYRKMRVKQVEVGLGEESGKYAVNSRQTRERGGRVKGRRLGSERALK